MGRTKSELSTQTRPEVTTHFVKAYRVRLKQDGPGLWTRQWRSTAGRGASAHAAGPCRKAASGLAVREEPGGVDELVAGWSHTPAKRNVEDSGPVAADYSLTRKVLAGQR
jgi:hypothetical protein